mmetsp:Transcript_39889/g.105831  ORF Transcript_39889/g.105831 Transcript_39889/m.105831 type:complete len:212 (-) Transcript_39889:30-665(-)
MARENLHELARWSPPHPDHGVARSSKQGMTLGVPQCPLDLLGRLKGVQQRSVGSPNFHCSIIGTRSHVLAVVTEGDLCDRIRVALETLPLCHSHRSILLRQTPQHGDIILSSSDNHLWIRGANCNREYCLRVSYKCSSLVSMRLGLERSVVNFSIVISHSLVDVIAVRRRNVIVAVHLDLHTISIPKLLVKLLATFPFIFTVVQTRSHNQN